MAYVLRHTKKKWLAEKILCCAEKIICANNYTAELAWQAWPDIKGKVAVVNPGVDDNFQLKNKYNLENKLILLSVGRLVKRKGFDKVIEAMPEVLKQLPDLVYLVIGDGDEFENFKLKIKNLGLEKHIKIINQAIGQERDNWYKACDIFIMPSRNINGDFEGFGMVYLEANLASKPVIAGRIGGIGDAVVDNLNGLLVDPLNTGQIAAAIIKLAKDPALRQQLGKQGRERSIREFNWKKHIDKIYKAITT